MRPEFRGRQPRPCWRCGGLKKVKLEIGLEVRCPACRGTGKLYIEVGGWNPRKFHKADNEPGYQP